MKKQSKAKILFRMIKLVKPLTGFMLLSVFFGTLGFLCAQFIPTLGAITVIRGLDTDGSYSFTHIFVVLIVIAILRAFLKFGEQRTNHYIAFTLLAIIRDKVFKALRRLCPAKLEGRDKGNLISLITSDVELLEVFYTHTISPVAIAFCVELIMVIFIGSFHWSLGLLAFCAFAAVGVILPLIISKRSGTLGDEIRADNGKLSAYMLENIRGLDETIQYGGGKERLTVLTSKTNELTIKQGKLNQLTGTNSALANTFILFSDIAMFTLCTVLYTNGIIGFDGFLIPLVALMSSFGPVIALAGLGTTLQATIASGARVLAVIDEVPETEDVTGKENIVFSGAAAQNVTFSYGGEKVLEDISVHFPENRIIGVVGRSGCGKSTLFSAVFLNSSSIFNVDDNNMITRITDPEGRSVSY